MILGFFKNLFSNFLGQKMNLFYILGIVLVFSLIFGYWYYQSKVFENLNETIKRNNIEIERLKLEKSILEQNEKLLREANNSLLEELKKKDEEYKKTIESLKRVNKILENSNKRLSQIEKKIKSSERKKVLKNKNVNDIRNLVKKENDFLKCYFENFGNNQVNCAELIG